MFVSDAVVYLQMHKTGSTHATRVLRQYCGGKEESKHSQLKDYHRYARRVIASSVRNPWDWYVSLWSFGCMGQGALRDYFERLPRSELYEARTRRDFAALIRFPYRALREGPKWISLYADSKNVDNFRIWLKYLLAAEGKHIGMEGYASSPIKGAVGLMTFRFLALTTEYSAWMSDGRNCKTSAEAFAFAEKHTITDRVLRMESLNADLANLLNAVGATVSPEEVLQCGIGNASDHNHYSSYYDAATRDLVASRDEFIVDQFEYSFAR